MKSYILRNIDADIWRRVRTSAYSRGLTINQLIEQLLRKEVEK